MMGMTRVSHVLMLGDDMRLGFLTVSTTVSAVLLSGCSFIGGQLGFDNNPYNNNTPYMNQNPAQYAQYDVRNQQAHLGNRCQVASRAQAMPRGCRPEQITQAVAPQGRQMAYGGGFPQQPQYTDGAYGSAVEKTSAVALNTSGPKKRKPKLRASFSIGAERSTNGNAIDFDKRPDLRINSLYNPQDFNESFDTGTEASGNITTTTYTANALLDANQISPANIRTDHHYESATESQLEFDDVWLTPLNVKGGVEYIVDDKTTVFANGGYSYAAGNAGTAGSVSATLYKEVIEQPYTPALTAAGDVIPGQFLTDGASNTVISYIPNQQIATFEYDFSDLKRFDVEVGARHYFKPVVKSEGYKTVTPFVGASVGISHVNAVDVTLNQTQESYQNAFEAGSTVDTEGFTVPSSGAVRLYDAQLLAQAQLNVGAEWQVTPTWALALESGLRFQDGRDYADYTDSSGNAFEGSNGDINVSIPLTLRGSLNF